MHSERTRNCVGFYYNPTELKKPYLQNKNYTLRYFFNYNNAFFHLFMHTKIYDKMINENIEKQGILLRSWNPITKRGERYIFRKGEEGDGDLNLKKVYLPNTKTIFEFSTLEEVNEESYNLAEEILSICPHKDIEIKIID
jgi:hypothetical protein